MSETDTKTDQMGEASSNCLLCDTTFKARRSYLRHMKNKHRNIELFTAVLRCELCKVICDTKEIFEAHIEEVHNGEAKVGHVCEKCGTKFITKPSLKKHMESQCGTTKLFKCQICNQNYANKASLAVHEMGHKGERRFYCSFCGKDFLSLGELTVHERKHTKEKPFKCDVCNKSFPYRESLVTHSSVHSGIKPYVCENCGNTFSCVGNLLKHRRVRPDTCGAANCSEKSTRIAPRPRTKKPKIPKTAEIQLPSSPPTITIEAKDYALFEVEYLEDIDDEELSSEKNIKGDHDEKTNAIERNVVGRIAEDQKDIADEIDSHIVSTLNEQDNDPLLCDEKTDDAYMIHIEEYTFESSDEHVEISSNENPNAETDTDSITNIASGLNEIVVKADDLVIHSKDEKLENSDIGEYSECPMCPSSYKTTNELLDHMKDVHDFTDYEIRQFLTMKEVEIKCSYCDKIYYLQNLYERHLRSHVYDTPAKQLNSAETVPNTVPIKTKDEIIASIYSPNFHCAKCDKKFCSRPALRNHEATNCGTTALFKCDVCNKVYHSLGSLKTHQTLHTGEKPFMCSYCGKNFRTKGQHDVHVRKHTGAKPFECHICSKSFSYRQSLVTHITTHTGEKPFVCYCGLSFSCVKNLLSHRNTFSTTCGKLPLNTKAVISIGVKKGQLYVGDKLK